MLLNGYKNLENMHNKINKLWKKWYWDLIFKKIKNKKPGGLVNFWKKGGPETDN